MKTTVRSDIAENRKPSVFKRVIAVLLVTVLLVGAAAYGGLYVLLKGPSDSASSQFTAAVAGNAVGDWVLRLFLTPDEIEQQLMVQEQNGGGSEKLFSVYPQLG